MGSGASSAAFGVATDCRVGAVSLLTTVGEAGMETGGGDATTGCSSIGSSNLGPVCWRASSLSMISSSVESTVGRKLKSSWTCLGMAGG